MARSPWGFKEETACCPTHPFSQPASRTRGPQAWLFSLVCAPGFSGPQFLHLERESGWVSCLLCPFCSKVQNWGWGKGAGATRRDLPEHRRGGKGSEEESSDLASLPRAAPRTEAVTLLRWGVRAAAERTVCSEASGCPGTPEGSPVGRAVWPQDGGEAVQGIIHALFGTHQTSPSS